MVGEMSQATRNPSKQPLCLHGNSIHKYTQTSGGGRGAAEGPLWGDTVRCSGLNAKVLVFITVLYQSRRMINLNTLWQSLAEADKGDSQGVVRRLCGTCVCVCLRTETGSSCLQT